MLINNGPVRKPNAQRNERHGSDTMVILFLGPVRKPSLAQSQANFFCDDSSSSMEKSSKYPLLTNSVCQFYQKNFISLSHTDTTFVLPTTGFLSPNKQNSISFTRQSVSQHTTNQSILQKKKKKKMTGILEVNLVDAKGLTDADSGGKMDPYVLIVYKGNTLKSSVAKDHGCNPVWNEKLSLWVEYPDPDGHYDLTLKVMDKDTFTKDDCIGETKICVKDIVALGAAKGSAHLEPRKYIVTGIKNKAHCGEIYVGLNFTLKGGASRAEV